MHLKLLKRRKFLQRLGLSALSFTLLLSQSTRVRSQTTYILQVSSHGGFFTENKSTFTLFEKNWEVKYFVREGECLDYDESIEIFKELADNNIPAVDGRVVETSSSGDSITDYDLWDLEDENYPSGVLKAGEVTPIVDIAGTTEDNPIKFSELLNQAIQTLGIKEEDKVVVYFNACRVESADETEPSCDLVSPGAPSLPIGCDN